VFVNGLNVLAFPELRVAKRVGFIAPETNCMKVHLKLAAMQDSLALNSVAVKSRFPID